MTPMSTTLVEIAACDALIHYKADGNSRQVRLSTRPFRRLGGEV